MNTTQMRAEEIRAQLVELGLSSEEVEAIKGKSALVAKLEELVEPGNILDNLEEVSEVNFPSEDNVIDVETCEGVIEKDDPAIPTPNSPEWTIYVLNQMTDGEKLGKAPNVHGLRRMVRVLMGDIVSSRVTLVECPNKDNGGRAVAVCDITVALKNKVSFNPTGYIDYSDGADAFIGNSEPPYNRHLVAMACSRAESRVLRKILQLNIISAEEMVDEEKLEDFEGNEFDLETRISNTQIMSIDTLCARLDINAMAYINSGANEYKSVNEVTRSAAAKMIKYLNSYQQDTSLIKPEITGYVEGWYK